MRKSPVDALIPKTRQLVISATTLDPDRWWRLSELARHIGVTPSSLQRELATLVDAGILESEPAERGARYRADRKCPLFPELERMMVKTAGVADVLRRALEWHKERVVAAFIFGSYARGTEVSGSDIDLMVVGDIGVADIAGRLKEAETTIGRPINVAVYSKREFSDKLAEGNHFLSTVAEGEKIFLIGDEDELGKLAKARAGTESRDKQKRARRASRSRTA